MKKGWLWAALAAAMVRIAVGWISPPGGGLIVCLAEGILLGCVGGFLLSAWFGPRSREKKGMVLLCAALGLVLLLIGTVTTGEVILDAASGSVEVSRMTDCSLSVGRSLRRLSVSYTLEGCTETGKWLRLRADRSQYEELEGLSGGEATVEYWEHTRVLRRVY